MAEKEKCFECSVIEACVTMGHTEACHTCNDKLMRLGNNEAEATTDGNATVDPSDWQVGDRFFVVGDYTEGVFPKIVEEVKGKKIISDLRIYLDNSDKFYTQEYFDLNYDELYNLDAERRKLQAEIDALKKPKIEFNYWKSEAQRLQGIIHQYEYETKITHENIDEERRSMQAEIDALKKENFSPKKGE